MYIVPWWTAADDVILQPVYRLHLTRWVSRSSAVIRPFHAPKTSRLPRTTTGDDSTGEPTVWCQSRCPSPRLRTHTCPSIPCTTTVVPETAGDEAILPFGVSCRQI